MTEVKRLFVFLAFACAAPAARAETIVASVNGMVCSLCVIGIENSFKRLPQVQEVKVDLAQKSVTVRTKDGHTIEDARVARTITNAGYKLVGISRN